jgi:hypothetical protein
MSDQAGEPAEHRISLICWPEQHVQWWTTDALLTINCAPMCSAPVGSDICGAPIWAVDHDGEPRRYVGRPPHVGWERWADCIDPPQFGRTAEPS